MLHGSPISAQPLADYELQIHLVKADRQLGLTVYIVVIVDKVS